MNALAIDKHKDSVKTAEEADVHHILQQNLYKPRRRVSSGGLKAGAVLFNAGCNKQVFSP